MQKFCLLTDHVCIEVRGADAGSFLAAQLSRTPRPGVLDHAPLAGWHDARGRVRALFRVWPLPDRWLLGTPRDGAEPLLSRLKMFVLRAAVTLGIAENVGLAAIVGANPDWLARRALPAAAPSGTIVTRGDVRWLEVGPGYWQALGPPAAIAELDPSLERVPPEAAALAEIGLGLPAITPTLVDKFVAQMLNLDDLGALSFDKGCYPGQEVIARVHNLGDVKRRARRYAATTATVPAVGTPVVAATGAAVGEVVRSAPAPGGCELLAVVDDVATDATLTIAGTPLEELPLPFRGPRAQERL
jgi:folate-binding protein YgfZ